MCVLNSNAEYIAERVKDTGEVPPEAGFALSHDLAHPTLSSWPFGSHSSRTIGPALKHFD